MSASYSRGARSECRWSGAVCAISHNKYPQAAIKCHMNRQATAEPRTGSTAVGLTRFTSISSSDFGKMDFHRLSCVQYLWLPLLQRHGWLPKTWASKLWACLSWSDQADKLIWWKLTLGRPSELLVPEKTTLRSWWEDLELRLFAFCSGHWSMAAKPVWMAKLLNLSAVCHRDLPWRHEKTRHNPTQNHCIYIINI